MSFWSSYACRSINYNGRRVHPAIGHDRTLPPRRHLVESLTHLLVPGESVRRHALGHVPVVLLVHVTHSPYDRGEGNRENHSWTTRENQADGEISQYTHTHPHHADVPPGMSETELILEILIVEIDQIDSVGEVEL